MPLKAVYDMVINRLAFVPQTGWEENIDDFKTEQMYYLDQFIDITGDIEDEANWTGMNRILLAELTTYQTLIKEIVGVVGGDGSETSTPGSGTKMIKKGKADVVEAEFEYSKADDGRTLSVKANQLVGELKQSICRYATSMGIHLPGYCPDEDVDPQPPFIIVEG